MDAKKLLFLLNFMMTLLGFAVISCGTWVMMDIPDCAFGPACILIGLATLFIVICGVSEFRSEETICLCILYIILSITLVILQIFTIIDIKRSNNSIHHPVLVLNYLSSSISLTSLILATWILKQTHTRDTYYTI